MSCVQRNIPLSVHKLNNAQFGFRKNSSAVLQLLFVDKLQNNYDFQEHDEIHVLYLDKSVPHQKTCQEFVSARTRSKTTQHDR